MSVNVCVCQYPYIYICIYGKHIFYTVVQPGKMMISGIFGTVTQIICPSRIHAGRAAAISALFLRTLELWWVSEQGFIVGNSGGGSSKKSLS
jgi:hypothetical protein